MLVTPQRRAVRPKNLQIPSLSVPLLHPVLTQSAQSSPTRISPLPHSCPSLRYLSQASFLGSGDRNDSLPGSFSKILLTVWVPSIEDTWGAAQLLPFLSGHLPIKGPGQPKGGEASVPLS